METAKADRDEAGRFTKGNAFGELTRFAPGTSGNPRGRPPRPDTWLRIFHERGYGMADLCRIAADPGARSTARAAARWGIAYLARDKPIRVSDPERAHRLYRRWYRRTFDALFDTYFDPAETCERREAARRRLRLWWTDRAQVNRRIDRKC